MLGKLLPVLMLVFGVGAGVGAGIALGPKGSSSDDQAETAAKAPAKDGHDKPAGDHASNKGEIAEASGNEYVKMSKPFVVPLVSNDRVAGLATVTLSLEVRTGFSDNFFAKEPKLRDGFLRVLFDHANIGGFDGAFTRPGTLDPLRVALRESAQMAFGDQIVEVLIVDIARQDS
ncbi:flagellar basal body-associated FliL family protein [Ruegeria aquimaris]|uniref:Flagellar basal body-associated FliL family protein n=1 Tax=Ruegeria aquimaris TaxID=2984333 RepID=A0ABT3AFJ8_9RHOB|nr:flagellar basal body-associated FliL family protein [Ruegeria sp. XHP0148]MCV2887460.1 flagellar basal body-associated FliL family protein [Ruegeria sp. XHP0148]